jgi:hypothetical protein
VPADYIPVYQTACGSMKQQQELLMCVSIICFAFRTAIMMGKSLVQPLLVYVDYYIPVNPTAL